MRAFVILGSLAHADGAARLTDLPGTGGRVDVLARCLRAALCVSHGIRRDVRVYAVLLGGAAPCTVRIDGPTAKFIRPDERSQAVLLFKAVARASPGEPGFVEQRHGIAAACAGLEAVLADLGDLPLFVLEEGAPDLRGTAVGGDAAFVLGDHTGFGAAARAALAAAGARPVGIGPRSLHTDDVITIVHNELDRRAVD